MLSCIGIGVRSIIFRNYVTIEFFLASKTISIIVTKGRGPFQVMLDMSQSYGKRAKTGKFGF